MVPSIRGYHQTKYKNNVTYHSCNLAARMYIAAVVTFWEYYVLSLLLALKNNSATPLDATSSFVKATLEPLSMSHFLPFEAAFFNKQTSDNHNERVFSMLRR